jgi:hypothetical protein
MATKGHKRHRTLRSRLSLFVPSVPFRGKTWAHGVLLLALLCMASAHGAPEQKSADEIPPLAPPLPEIPPTFWEQHGLLVSMAVLVFVALLAFALWLLLRPKPVLPVPPEVRVRAELQAMLGGPETGEVLSRISQSLRRYLAAAFALPPEELTTTEFCRQLEASPTVGTKLAAAVSGFLRECDERKFAPAPVTAPLGAVQRALELVAQAEVRRRETRSAGLPPDLHPAGETPALPS